MSGRGVLLGDAGGMRPPPPSAMPWSFTYAWMPALFPRLASVRGVQVDLVDGVADPEPHRLIRWAALEDVGHLRCHRGLHAGGDYLHGADHLPCRNQLSAFAAAPADSGEPNGEPTPAGVRPHEATASHSLPS
jgi:hypothetical protein